MGNYTNVVNICLLITNGLSGNRVFGFRKLLQSVAADEAGASASVRVFGYAYRIFFFCRYTGMTLTLLKKHYQNYTASKEKNPAFLKILDIL